MRKPALKLEHAYTLIEILVGLTVIGLIFSVGFVSFREFSRRQALSSVARSIKGDLRLAQEKALAGTKPADMKCNPPEETLEGYEFRKVDDRLYSIEAVCSGGRVEVRRTDMPGGYIMSEFEPPPIPDAKRIAFKVVGQGTNIETSTVITITQEETGRTQTITVSSTGEIK